MEGGGGEDAGQLGAEEVAFLAGELGVGLDGGVEVAGEHGFDLAGGDDPLRLTVRQLHPIMQDIVRDPVNQLVHARAARLTQPLFLLDVADAAGDPVVILAAVDFTHEPDLVAP